MDSLTPSRRDQGLRLMGALLVALCGARPAFAYSPVLGGITAVALGGFALGAAPAGPRGALARVSLLVGGALAGWGSPASFGLAEPWRAFFAQQPGQTPLLLLRAGLFVALILATEAQSRGARLVSLGATGALLMASLSFRVLFVPYCVGALLVLGWCARRAPVAPFAPDGVLSGGGLVLAALSLLGPHAAPPGEQEPAHPAAAIAWWLRRENPYQAHYRAARWAKDERVPGEGYLALARLDVTLGRKDRARKVLAKLVERGASEDARSRAKELQRGLDLAPNAAHGGP